MRSGNEKPAGNTLCIGKGFEAAWAFFCPSKPCVSLSIDGIFVVDHGEIVQQGTHDELVAVDGLYRLFVVERRQAVGWKI